MGLCDPPALALCVLQVTYGAEAPPLQARETLRDAWPHCPRLVRGAPSQGPHVTLRLDLPCAGAAILLWWWLQQVTGQSGTWLSISQAASYL